MIPAEIVGLYLARRTAINTKFPSGTASDPNALLSEPWAWLIWGVFCLVVVFFVRRWATSDKARDVPPEAGAVAIAMISFAIWVYSFGDLFRVLLHVWDPLLATFLGARLDLHCTGLLRAQTPITRGFGRSRRGRQMS